MSDNQLEVKTETARATIAHIMGIDPARLSHVPAHVLYIQLSRCGYHYDLTHGAWEIVLDPRLKNMVGK